jgi:predicted metal-dependent peptidase
MPRTRRGRSENVDPALANLVRGQAMVSAHPLFVRLMHRVYLDRWERDSNQRNGWIEVTHGGRIRTHPTRRAEPEEWAYALAHGLLHLAFGHLTAGHGRDARAWTATCCLAVSRFLADLRAWPPVPDLEFELEGAPRTEEQLYRFFLERGIPDGARLCAPGGLLCEAPPPPSPYRLPWERLFADGLADAVRGVLDEASGRGSSGTGRRNTTARRARDWVISSYPLLGALAARFEIVDDPAICTRLDVAITAVNESVEEIYVNPGAGLDDDEARFVLAHELLHVGLRHADRREGRDPHLWNVSADYVINGWLVEMGVGKVPGQGCLYDPDLKGESAESVYDRLVTDLRRGRRLQTLRGRGLGDIIEGGPCLTGGADGMSLDEYCRWALAQGLEYHQHAGRGLLPAGLVEEIRALAQPPIAWDVQLARWFAERFPLPERARSYARASRRQSSTPDIPRPTWVPPTIDVPSRTFGVVLDTSGSMERALLAKALGAIASYSIAREVPAARVVFCDAVAYDEGYLAPETITDRVRIRGRGGTVLQPGIDLLERAEDFPKDGPILIITDTFCDHVHSRRDHAFLIPKGRTLPFSPRGPVFRIE